MTNIKHDMGPADKPRDDGSRYFVAAYTTSPSGNAWSPELEKQYFQALAQKPEIVGIEHPLYLDSDKYPLDWLVDNIPLHWSIIITALPTFMVAAKANSFLGLASQREHDRSLAVKLMEQIGDYALQLNQAFDRNIVKTIHFHSLPQNDEANLRGHKDALKKSLVELKNLYWGDINLNLEHCDAYIPNQVAEKGFLSLEDEIESLLDVSGFGMVLNWARSAIEGRSVMTPIKHIEMAKNANLLKGFFFSGCTDDPKSSCGAWKDTHMPPGGDSLLGAEEVKQVFLSLGSEVYLGIKVSDIAKQKTLAGSVALNVNTIDALSSSRGMTAAKDPI